MTAKTEQFNIDILIFEDGDYYSAVAVRMDIWGYGSDIESARDECIENVVCQITYALQIDDISILDMPADEKYLDMFKCARLDALRSRYIKDRAHENAKRKVSALECPIPNNIEIGRNFKVA